MVYTDSRNTEAWVLQLKPEAIREWLESNGADVAMLQGDALSGLPALREDERYITMLHSVSHSAILVLAGLAGIEDESLEEILLPDVAGFALYSASGELGALGAVYEQSITAFADALPRGLDKCRFDPVCTEHEGSACIGCLQLARGCERYNQMLSRATLIASEVGKPGYWTNPR